METNNAHTQAHQIMIPKHGKKWKMCKKKLFFWYFIVELLNVAIFGETFATGLFKPKTHVTLLLDTYCERICTRPVNGYVCWFCAHLDFKTYTSETWSACARDDSKKESTQNKQYKRREKEEKSTKHFKQIQNRKKKSKRKKVIPLKPKTEFASRLWNGLCLII